MAESTWPTLRIGIPDDVSDHAACLQNDFEEVHRSLQATGGTVIPRYLFDILHRSYSRLCAKLNIEGDEGSSHNSTLSPNVKCEEHYTGPPQFALTASEEDDTGVYQVPSTSTSDWERDSQSNHQHNPEYAIDLGEQQQAERGNREPGELTSEKSDQHRQSHSEASSSCVVLRAQDPEPAWGRTTGINYRDEILRKAMVEAMHESKFSITLGVDSDVLTDENDRESLLRYLKSLCAVDMSLDIYDSINEDPAILDPTSLWICHSKITKRKKLMIFINSTLDGYRLKVSDYWKTRLATKSIMDIRRKNPSAFESLGKGELPAGILKDVSVLSSRKAHKHKSQSRSLNSFSKRKLKKMIDSRVKQVDHDAVLFDWLGGVELSKDSAEPAAPKRKAAEPLELSSGNVQSSATVKRIKREEAEEDPIQQYIRENGAIPWPPSREERTVDTMEALSRRQRPRKSNVT